MTTTTLHSALAEHIRSQETIRDGLPRGPRRNAYDHRIDGMVEAWEFLTGQKWER